MPRRHPPDRPEDIDVILVLPADWNFKAELRPFEYNLLWRKSTRAKYGLDVFAVTLGSARETELTAFFGQLNPKWVEEFALPAGTRKGIVKVSP